MDLKKKVSEFNNMTENNRKYQMMKQAKSGHFEGSGTNKSKTFVFYFDSHTFDMTETS